MIAHVTDWAESIGAVRIRSPLSSRSSLKVLTVAMLPRGTSLRRSSETLQRARDRLGPELDCRRRHAFVGGVDDFEDWKFLWQPHRHEAVRLDAELREEAAVCHAALEQRHRDPFGIELSQHAAEHLEEPEVGLSGARVVPYELDLDVVADDPVELRDQLIGREAGKEAAVELELDLCRDDVHLLPAADDRRVDGVAEQRLDRPELRPEAGKHTTGDARLEQRQHQVPLRPRQLRGDRLDHVADDRRDVDRERLAVEVTQHLRESSHRPVAVDHGPVAAAAADRRLQPADLLLAELDRVEALARDLPGDPARFSKGMPDAGEKLGMLLDEELRAVVAAVLLVAEDDEDHVSRQLELASCRAQKRRDVHRDGALHVDGAASPNFPRDQIAAERRPCPGLARGGDDVDVPLEEERPTLSLAVETCDEIRASRIFCIEPALDPRLLEQAAHELDALAFVPGRVRRVEPDQALEELDGSQ